jgi:uncharacterized protein (TIGR00299 family) protein
MHYHLDPVGGMAGDMFVGALLDAFPDLAQRTIAAVRAAGLPMEVDLAHRPYDDGVLQGSRFVVTVQDRAHPALRTDHDHVHHHPHDHGHAHEHHPAHGPAAAGALTHTHVTWSTLRGQLADSALAPPVRERALAIFSVLAEAEARVHGIAADAVAFHEVGAWDSIADIVAAAFLIDALGPCTWSVGALPLGSGRVATAHGLLPVPAPATVLLLAGFECFDDGFAGERITPTGAAILKHLAPTAGLGPAIRPLHRVGYGFGMRRFAGMSNVLRVLEFATVPQTSLHADRVAVLRFEIDDQTAEDLALGLERIRQLEGVLDVTQAALTGKRGRLASGIQVLARPEAVERVTAACFRETTTLGLRLQTVDRVTVPRAAATSATGVRVKIAARPDGRTAKAELADVDDVPGHRNRAARREAAEVDALGQVPDDD